MGLETDARAAFEKARDLDPQCWLAWSSLGMLHIAHGRPAEAMLPEIEASSREAYPAMAYFHFAGGDIEQAIESAGRALDEGYAMLPNMFIFHSGSSFASQPDGLDRYGD